MSTRTPHVSTIRVGAAALIVALCALTACGGGSEPGTDAATGTAAEPKIGVDVLDDDTYLDFARVILTDAGYAEEALAADDRDVLGAARTLCGIAAQVSTPEEWFDALAEEFADRAGPDADPEFLGVIAGVSVIGKCPQYQDRVGIE